MKIGRIITALAIATLLPFHLAAQEKPQVKINYGIKLGFQGVTYNTTDFCIDGYSFNDNTIQSDKVGFLAAPFVRLTKGKFYLQTEAAFGITYHNYDFIDTESLATAPTPNTAEYELKTYCVKVPLLIGYNFISYPNYGMSAYTGPRVKFAFTSASDQSFASFKYADMHEELNKTEWYWEIGLGIRIYNVIIDFAYDWGFHRSKTGIIAPADNLVFTSKRSNNVLSFSAGFIF